MRKIVTVFIVMSCFLFLTGCYGNRAISKGTAVKTFHKEVLYKKEAEPWMNVSFDKYKIEKLQKEADNGHQPGLMDPEQVAWDFADNKLNVKRIIESELKTEKDNTKIILITTGDKKIIEIQLSQKGEKGVHGIWTVVRYRYLS